MSSTNDRHTFEIACTEGNIEYITECCNRGIVIDDSFCYGLYNAIEDTHLNIVKLLIKNLQKDELTFVSEHLSYTKFYEQEKEHNPILLAVINEDMNMLKFILEETSLDGTF